MPYPRSAPLQSLLHEAHAMLDKWNRAALSGLWVAPAGTILKEIQDGEDSQ